MSTTPRPESALFPTLVGRGGWALWWPLVPWLVDALTVGAFRPDAVTEPALVLGVASVTGFAVLWFWRATRAIRLGHPLRPVVLFTLVASFGAYVVQHVAGAAARVVEASVVGNDAARVFITTFGKDIDHTRWFGAAEGVATFGLLVLLVLTVAGWGVCRRVDSGLERLGDTDPA